MVHISILFKDEKLFSLQLEELLNALETTKMSLNDDHIRMNLSVFNHFFSYIALFSMMFTDSSKRLLGCETILTQVINLALHYKETILEF